MKRPWKERLARNCDEISRSLLDEYRVETGLEPTVYPREFLDWVGLSPSPTALKRVQNPLRK